MSLFKIVGIRGTWSMTQRVGCEHSILFRFAQPNRKHCYDKSRRQEMQQIVEGAASNNRVYNKNLRHAKYRLQAGEYKKMSHAIANNKNKNNRKKQPRVNWSASSGVIFTRSGI